MSFPTAAPNPPSSPPLCSPAPPVPAGPPGAVGPCHQSRLSRVVPCPSVAAPILRPSASGSVLCPSSTGPVLRPPPWCRRPAALLLPAAVQAGLPSRIAGTIFLNSIQPMLSGVAIGAGWQSLVVFINIGCYYLVGIPFGVLFGFKLKLQCNGDLGGYVNWHSASDSYNCLHFL
ncbi:hypothetical protein ABZP36_009319 [Zizania latifolia]